MCTSSVSQLYNIQQMFWDKLWMFLSEVFSLHKLAVMYYAMVIHIAFFDMAKGTDYKYKGLLQASITQSHNPEVLFSL